MDRWKGRMVRATQCVFFGVFIAGLVSPAAQPAPPTFADRIAAQRALERVDYAHLNWPEGNREPRPSFDELYPEVADAAAVSRGLQMGTALDRLWRESVAPAEIQAEMDRMARDSKMPDRLQEYLSALGNDPLLVAECLVRPRLVEQRLRERYTWDARIHGAVRERAQDEVIRSQAMGALGGLSAERTQLLFLTPERMGDRSPGEGEMLLDGESWQALRRKFADGGSPSFNGRLGALQESEEAFFAQTATEVQKGSLLVTTYSWPKRPFDAWWEEVGPTCDEERPAASAYRLPSLPDQPAEAHQSWSAISETGAPSARRKHTAAWTGSRMIVWGGEDFSGVTTNSGGQYDPATDSWTNTTTTNAPTARTQYRCGVWTSAYLLVWGGSSGTTYYDTGARYSPTGNAWVALTKTNAPVARTGHSATYVPSLNRIVVWGGYTGMEVKDGKNLDSLSAWYDQAVTTTYARKNHAAGYDNGVAGLGGIVMWGGSSAALPDGMNSGATYSNGGGWAAMTTTGAPSARENATGVWRPEQYFIVWGGNSGTAVLGNGARWVANDTWTTLNATGAPSARTFHTAVWASNQTGMIVWGGQTLATTPTYFADGALYSASGNSWTSLAATGAPSARSYHTAVYATGTNSDVMFVWGGTSGSRVTNTGGAYHFCRVTSVPATTDTIAAVDKNSSECTATGVQVTWPQDPNGGWNDDGFGPRSYTVYRDATAVTTVAYPITTAVDSGGTPNTAYTYTVRYTNGCGHTGTTAGVQASDVTDTIPCVGPTDSLRVAKAGASAGLSWGAVAGCADLVTYRVYASASFGAAFPAGWTLLPAPTGTTTTDPLASSYRAYKVVSVDICGNLSQP